MHALRETQNRYGIYNCCTQALFECCDIVVKPPVYLRYIHAYLKRFVTQPLMKWWNILPCGQPIENNAIGLSWPCQPCRPHWPPCRSTKTKQNFLRIIWFLSVTGLKF